LLYSKRKSAKKFYNDEDEEGIRKKPELCGGLNKNSFVTDR
jgi:hypothetical protein